MIDHRYLAICAIAVCSLNSPAIRRAVAQNGSLLHAPLTGRVIDTSPSARVELPYPQQLPQLAPNQTVPFDSVGPPPGNTGQPPTALLNAVSWTYQPAPPTRVFRKKDLVTIRVDEITRMAAEGSAESRKRTLYNAAITDWIQLSKFTLKPDPQVDGDPRIGARSDGTYLAESNIESRESMAFNIAATIVDIRPNGSMLLEARKTIRVNDNLWETSLTGLCRAQDISPDNVVLSKDLIDLDIKKQDRGHLRDGYKRGWLQRWIDQFQPF